MKGIYRKSRNSVLLDKLDTPTSQTVLYCDCIDTPKRMKENISRWHSERKGKKNGNPKRRKLKNNTIPYLSLFIRSRPS